MRPRLSDILAAKYRELVSEVGLPKDSFRGPFPALRDFRGAVCRPDRIGIIAEIKRASPSAGVIRGNADPARIAASYERAGAAAVSVVTEREFFKGDPETLSIVRTAVSIPVLRKDFILEESQIYESRMLGADAVLLIAGILSKRRLSQFLELCDRLGMAALTEVHSEADMEKAMECGAGIVGINNRDLDSFEVSLETTRTLAPLAPPGCCLVSESGIRTPEDLDFLQPCGIKAALVGTALMSAEDPGDAALRLVRAGETTGREGC